MYHFLTGSEKLQARQLHTKTYQLCSSSPVLRQSLPSVKSLTDVVFCDKILAGNPRGTCSSWKSTNRTLQSHFISDMQVTSPKIPSLLCLITWEWANLFAKSYPGCKVTIASGPSLIEIQQNSQHRTSEHEGPVMNQVLA